MFIDYGHESIRLTGRWDTSDPHCAVTTTTGAYIEFAFEGRMALARFDVFTNATPRLHLWIQLDGGDMIEAPIDSYLRIIAKNDGKHICRIIYKGGTENDRRWFAPLTGKVSFIGVQVEAPIAIGDDTRDIIEFVGDSITEGVLIDMDYNCPDEILSYIDQNNRVYQDDACATYAWLTAEALDLRPIIMGYGSVGATRAGQGRVPAANIAYPFNFDGSPITHAGKPRYIVVNHGANDRKKTVDEYLSKYGELLDVIREMNPDATLISLSAFCGAFHTELGEYIEKYNAERGCKVHYIDSFGWISPTPLHPYREGHRTVAEHLSEKMKEIIDNQG